MPPATTTDGRPASVAELREIVRRGHAVENHSNAHEHTFAFLMFSGLRRDLSAAQSTILGLTGRAPRFFRTPTPPRPPASPRRCAALCR